MSELVFGQLKGLSVNNNVVRVPAGHTLYAPGHVIQVVAVSSSTQIQSTASTFVSTGLAASITPKFSSSKVLVVASYEARNYPTNIASIHTIFRGDTSTGVNLGTHSTTPGLTQLYTPYGEIRVPLSMSVLDSPASTALVTYTAAFNPVGGNAYVMPENRKGTITLMEIAA